jgi:hypothetical protein
MTPLTIIWPVMTLVSKATSNRLKRPIEVPGGRKAFLPKKNLSTTLNVMCSSVRREKSFGEEDLASNGDNGNTLHH